MYINYKQRTQIFCKGVKILKLNYLISLHGGLCKMLSPNSTKGQTKLT